MTRPERDPATAAPWFSSPRPCDTDQAVVIGAGIAGCTISDALCRRGLSVTLIDAGDGSSGASANTRGILRPHVSRAATLQNRFNEQAFKASLQRLQALHGAALAVDYRQIGVLQLLARRGHWPALDTAVALDRQAASRVAGVTLNSDALHFPAAGWINAQSYCQALLSACHPLRLYSSSRVRALHRHADRWQLICEGNAPRTIESALVVLAAGAASPGFAQLRYLDLQISAGQTTRCRYRGAAPPLRTILAGRRFVIPETDYCTIGATHRRHCSDTQGRDTDDRDNLAAAAALLPALSAQLQPVQRWRALRLSTADRLPLAGAVPDSDFFRRAYTDLRHGPGHRAWPRAAYLDGLYVHTGFGSRGYSTATLTAEILADLITGAEVNALQQQYRQLLHPARFVLRQLKRGR